MVERLKKAIDKAHAERLNKEALTSDTATTQTVLPAVAEPDLWGSISPLEVDQKAMSRSHVVSLADQHPARTSFDILRTRMTKLLRENDWSKIAVTSSSKGEGKTFVSLNLARSLARNQDNRVLLFDLDLRVPGLSKALHVSETLRIDRFLRNEIEPKSYLRRIENNLLVGLNSRRIPDSAELIQSESAIATLDATIAEFKPTIAIYDLPPLMVSDDTIGILDYVDGALLVAAAGETATKEIAESERLILEHTNLVGVILNKGEQSDAQKYYY